MPFIKTHENLHKNVNENMFSFTFLCKFSCIFHFAIFVQIFMKFSPKCRTKKLGKIYTVLGSFCSFFHWLRADIRSQIRPRKMAGFSAAGTPGAVYFTCLMICGISQASSKEWVIKNLYVSYFSINTYVVFLLITHNK